MKKSHFRAPAAEPNHIKVVGVASCLMYPLPRLRGHRIQSGKHPCHCTMRSCTLDLWLQCTNACAAFVHDARLSSDSLHESLHDSLWSQAARQPRVAHPIRPPPSSCSAAHTASSLPSYVSSSIRFALSSVPPGRRYHLPINQEVHWDRCSHNKSDELARSWTRCFTLDERLQVRAPFRCRLLSQICEFLT